MQYHPVVLNPLLISSPTGTAYFRPVYLDWDIRRAPHCAARVAGQVVSAHELAQPATFPGIPALRIISDLLGEDWVMTAYNSTGVTVEDVLTTIYAAFHAPLIQSEWDCMPSIQRARIEDVFYARCEASRDFDRTRYGGVRRMDCLLHTTVFAGLSSLMFRNGRWEAVLTLSRHCNARGTRSHPEGYMGGTP